MNEEPLQVGEAGGGSSEEWSEGVETIETEVIPPEELRRLVAGLRDEDSRQVGTVRVATAQMPAEEREPTWTRPPFPVPPSMVPRKPRRQLLVVVATVGLAVLLVGSGAMMALALGGAAKNEESAGSAWSTAEDPAPRWPVDAGAGDAARVDMASERGADLVSPGVMRPEVEVVRATTRPHPKSWRHRRERKIEYTEDGSPILF